MYGQAVRPVHARLYGQRLPAVNRPLLLPHQRLDAALLSLPPRLVSLPMCRARRPSLTQVISPCFFLSEKSANADRRFPDKVSGALGEQIFVPPATSGPVRIIHVITRRQSRFDVSAGNYKK